MKDHIFSKEYKEKKAALLKGIERADSYRDTAVKAYPVRIIAAAAVLVMLIAAVFASGIVNFSIRDEEGVTVVDFVNGLVSEVSVKYAEDGEYPKYILHRDYMPSVTGREPGCDGFWDFGKAGEVKLNIHVLYPADGQRITFSYPKNATARSLSVGDREAVYIDYGEGDRRRDLLIAFEDEGVILACLADTAISLEELVKLGEGLRLEPASDGESAYPGFALEKLEEMVFHE